MYQCLHPLFYNGCNYLSKLTHASYSVLLTIMMSVILEPYDGVDSLFGNGGETIIKPSTFIVPDFTL